MVYACKRSNLQKSTDNIYDATLLCSVNKNLRSVHFILNEENTNDNRKNKNISVLMQALDSGGESDEK